ncbi:MAG: hypothetical protein ACI8QD_001871 [Cyclobacteriaceae bacterium]|jgi:hypothetical protein
MKKSIIILAAAFLSFTTLFANGNEVAKKIQQIAMFDAGDKQFRLIYPFKDERAIKITITDQYGKVVGTDFVHSNSGFLRKYNMEALAPGAYQIELASAKENLVKPFSITNKQVMAINDLGNEQVKLILTHEIQEGTIKIYNAESELLHNEKYDSKKGNSRMYDLSKYENTDFTFVLVGEATIAVNLK